MSLTIHRSAKVAGIIAACDRALDDSPGFYISQHEWDKYVELRTSKHELRSAMRDALVHQVPLSLAAKKHGVDAAAMNIIAGNLWFKVFAHRFRPNISRDYCSLPLIAIDNSVFSEFCEGNTYSLAQSAGFYLGWVAGFEFQCVSGMRVVRHHMNKVMQSIVGKSRIIADLIPEYHCFNCGSKNRHDCCSGLITNHSHVERQCPSCGSDTTWLIPWRTKWSAHVTWVCGHCLWRRNMMLHGFGKSVRRHKRRVEEIFDPDFIDDRPEKIRPDSKFERLA
jgi:hypothetical protein